MDEYCAYLRKSRSDYEAEQRGEGETLARHRKMLMNAAKAKGIVLKKFYCEIVSGETISARPQMQQLLTDVESGLWSGVFVVEIERLARGDTSDQGIVQRVFRVTNTKIITPLKEYDPTNEFDNEYFEFGLFMSRREYNTTKRRLQNGRISAATEGKWPYRTPPYGYEILKIPNDKGYTLKINQEEADIVRLIFLWYTTGFENLDGSFIRIGMQVIANKLNSMNILPRISKKWSLSTIACMLDNPTYIGKVKISYNKTTEVIQNGVITKKRIKNKNCILVDGLHDAIIKDEIFYLAKELRSQNPPKPIKEHITLKNPLSGIVECAYCKKKMIRRPYSNKFHTDTLICPSPGCKNISANLSEVEHLVITFLEQWLENYKLNWNLQSEDTTNNTALMVIEKSIQNTRAELACLEQQLSNLHDLLERRIYTEDTFISRRNILLKLKLEKQEILTNLEQNLSMIKARDKAKSDIIPDITHAIDTYATLNDAQQKNELLCSVLDKVVYKKEKKCTKKESKTSHIKLKLYPKLPKHVY